MAGKTDKPVSASKVYNGFSGLIEDLVSLEGDEARFLAHELKALRKRAVSLITGEPTEAEKRNLDARTRRNDYVKELVYIGGDPENGAKKSVQLTENDLIEMADLGIRFSYLTDVLFGLAVQGGEMVKLVFPDGITGMLYIKYSSENGTLDYTFRKDSRRVDEAA